MWYSYNLQLIKENKMEKFTKDFEKAMIALFENKENYFEPLKKFNKTKLKEYLANIKLEYEKLTLEEKFAYMCIFKNNYNIEEIIVNKSKVHSFKDLRKKCGIRITKLTGEMCEYLYENFKELYSFSKEYISPKEYYKLFVKQGIVKGICPFCGRKEMEYGESKGREDFDHYLAKAKYPFISMHYKNLVPMCHLCNSKVYKGESDIITLEKIYYPYANRKWENILEIKEIDHKKVNEIIVKKVEIKDRKSDKVKEKENQSWHKIFQIEDRIKEKLKVKQKEVIADILSDIEYREIQIKDALKSELKYKIKKVEEFRYHDANIFIESLLKYYLKDLNFFKHSLKKY